MTSITGICDIARRGEPCTVCHVLAGQPCNAPACHFCRIGLAADDGLITMLEKAFVMRRLGVCTGASLVPATAVTS